MSISSQTVQVAIVLATRAASAANFGTPAVFCNAPFVGGKLYEASAEGLSAMVTDGFTVNDRGYKLVSSMVSQQPHAAQVLVYNRAALTTNSLVFTPLNTTDGTVYSFTITYKGVSSDISHTNSSDTVESICDAIKILIDASLAAAEGITVVDDVTNLDLNGDDPGEPVQISNLSPALATLLDASADAGIATDLAAAAAVHSFYRFVIDSYSEAENNAAAVWAEANENLFFAHSADSTNVVDAVGSGVGQDYFTAGYNRASVWHNGDMPGNAAACIVGRQAALDAGTSSYAYQDLTGCSPDALTAAQISNGLGKNINLFAYNDGNRQTWGGAAASGRSLRIQSAIDLLTARIKESVLSTFLANEFIPMSDNGFSLQESAVRGVLARFAGPGGFIQANGFTVSVPTAASLSASDISNGVLRGLKFSAIIPNDMNQVIVQGTVSFV